ncbi:dTDP-4-amino-4,6-dideoxy-D-glucose acyltransferase [Desulfosarcina cetonica]|uniref:acyltransferase n=1 Tax=Desulfosarcina cetonica TaxID=90730 RepID=UPI0009F8E4FE|nr:acyltransferase [Desulfosarcina cetonica]VTR64706.1 dTDP-4-amino-4,6-dideoxy-D-glucose acyltransferase [Desulfosarcina cetonica]
MNPFDQGYYDEHELKNAGFKSIGQNVKIAKNCTIIGLQNISIGNNVRIDDYCSILADNNGWCRIGSFIHIGAYSFLSAGDGIQMEDFSGLSQGVRIYSKSDDYSGNYLTNPTVPEKYSGVKKGMVRIGRHVIIGSGAVILPNISIGEGSSVGALSLVATSIAPWCIYAGCPAKWIKSRSKQLLALEAKLIQEVTNNDNKYGVG